MELKPTPRRKTTPIFSDARMSELISGDQEDLQKKVNARLPLDSAMRGDPKIAKAIVGQVVYKRADDVIADYKRTSSHMADFYAAPVNYNSLRVGLLATLHDFMSDADRKKAEELISKMAPVGGDTSGKSALDDYKEKVGVLKANPEECAYSAKVLIDVFNQTSKKRHAFAKKNGLLEEFGFMVSKKNKDGTPTGKMVDGGPLTMEEPEALLKEIDGYQRRTKKLQIDVGVDDLGKQKFTEKTRRGFWMTGVDRTFGEIGKAEGSTEFVMGCIVGGLAREGLIKIGQLFRLTKRVSADACATSVHDVKMAKTLRDDFHGATEARPYEAPALPGASPGFGGAAGAPTQKWAPRAGGAGSGGGR